MARKNILEEGHDEGKLLSTGQPGWRQGGGIPSKQDSFDSPPLVSHFSIVSSVWSHHHQLINLLINSATRQGAILHSQSFAEELFISKT